VGYSTTVTQGEVKREAPLNPEEIGAASFVSNAVITEWIRESAGVISALADAHNVTLTDADAVRVADRGVKAFTISKILQTMSANEAVVARYWNEWLDMRGVVELRIQTLGADYSATTGLPTNVDTTDPKARTWVDPNTDRGDGWTGW